ncbi:MAG: CapA family protein [candidate division WOR-3 bacterium]
MKKILIILSLLFAILSAQNRYQTIENFDSGAVRLYSYPNQDLQPSHWCFDSLKTYNHSRFSLKIYGNTWKIESIPSRILDTNCVWQVACYIEELGEIQGFGLMDSDHVLFYAFAGSEQLNIQEWITVYQGAFSQDSWHLYSIPVGQDWLNYFGYLPIIKAIVFINDRDFDSIAVVYFDQIIDITEDLPIAPQVFIWDSIISAYKDTYNRKNVTVQFYSLIIDPDSDEHQYYWSFGDGETSTDSNPIHTYFITDDHPYTVLLQVRDTTNLWGRATCQIQIDSGQTSFPITLSIVGDIMLGRRYEGTNGIINTYGVETIFSPTRHYLHNSHISIANLECPLTDQGSPHPTKPILFRTRPQNIQGLVYAGIDLVSLANNHILDYGLVGINQTQRVLDSVNIRHCGAGANSYQAGLPVFINKAGVNLGFLAYSDRTGQYNNYQPYLNAGYNKAGFALLDTFNLRSDINSIRNNADLIVVQMHSGSEYSLAPQPKNNNEDEFYDACLLVPCSSDIKVRHFAIEHGADLVINHHPHIIQGFEVYQGKLIAHSLGNFVFDLDYPETYATIILNVKINRHGFYEYSVIPVYIDNYIPRRASGALGIAILRYLSQKSKEFNTYLLLDYDSIIGTIILDTIALNPFVTSYTQPVNLTLQNNYWQSPPLSINESGFFSALTNIEPSRNWQVRLGKDLTWFWYGNFEDEGSNNWLFDNPNEFYDTIAYQGHRSLCQRRPPLSGSLVTNLKNYIICYQDTTQYTLSAYLKTENTNQTTLLVKCYASRTVNTPLATISLDTLTGTHNWQLLYKAFIPPAGTKFFDIHLRSTAHQTLTARSWFDNISLIQWENWQPLANLTDIPIPNDYTYLQIRTNQITPTATVNYQTTNYRITQTIVENSNPPPPKLYLTIYPIPAVNYLNIQYHLDQIHPVEIKIYNSLGQIIKTLSNTHQSIGLNNLIWDRKDNYNQPVPNGIYFVKLKTNKAQQTQKIILNN